MVSVSDVITRWLSSSLTWHHRLVRISLLFAHSFVWGFRPWNCQKWVYFSNHRLVTEVTKMSKYTGSSKLLTGTKEMQIGKTGESFNGLNHELLNSTLFCFKFFSFILYYLSEICSFIAHEWPLFQGCGSNLVDKRLLLCYHLTR